MQRAIRKSNIISIIDDENTTESVSKFFMVYFFGQIAENSL